MLHAPPAPRSRTLAAAFALSLLAHLGLLLMHVEPPPAPARSATLEARVTTKLFREPSGLMRTSMAAACTPRLRGSLFTKAALRLSFLSRESR